jgi:1-deoxy-D-xylulose-5-phosphate reductoisomerase
VTFSLHHRFNLMDILYGSSSQPSPGYTGLFPYLHSNPLLLYDSCKMSYDTGSVKKLAVLGSTGSVGKQTLDIVRAMPESFKIVGLAAGDNLALLEKQIGEFKPGLVYYRDRGKNLNIGDAHFLPIEEIAAYPDVDIVVCASSGKSGLSSVLAAIKANKKIALANKEPLVMAGEIILREMKKSSGWILPIDSEHSAIWQCMNGEAQKPARIILTASGGPFLRYSTDQLAGITVEDALKHPSWNMGKKVTIDSATLMNKGLEVIEAHWLFDMPFDRIDILVHTQSIVHSMVELTDGTFKAQLSYPDMRFPIQYALSYPGRLKNPSLPVLDWTQISDLKFERINYKSFPCLKLALEAGVRGGTYPAVLCGADEVAVELFLKKRISFISISELIDRVIQKHQYSEHPEIDAIMEADVWARSEVLKLADGVN